MSKMDDQHKLKIYQRVMFFVLFVGYMLYILDRKSFAFMIPTVTKTENLDSESIGSVLSAVAVGYAIGKFVVGILVDTYSCKYMFATGLVICGAVNIGFSFTSSPSVYTILWFVNGLAQGFGWPTCGKLLKRWYPPVVFGTLWSLLSTSMNVAASIGPFLCNSVIDTFGSWRYCMQGFGIASILASFLALTFLQDFPEDYGISADFVQGKKPDDSSTSKNEEPSDKTPDKKTNVGLGEALGRILISPYTYVIGLGFFVSILCKGTICDWGPMYIITEKNATKTTASLFSGVLETGGIVGSIVAGTVSDWFVSISAKNAKGHPRNIFTIPCTFALLASMSVLRLQVEDVAKQHALTMFLAFTIGFTVYGLISIVGVMVIERSAGDISGRAHALTALFGNIGLASAGLPFSAIIKNYSWSTAYAAVECSVLLLAIAFIFSQAMNCRIGEVKEKEE